MAGRASVWSDPKVRELSGAFTPATDESYRLQTTDDPEARFFRTMIHGTPDRVQGSRQGTYVCTPAGRLLARGNSTDPRAIERILAGGLAAWNALDAGERARPVPEALRPRHRYEHFYPADGLALRSVLRERVLGDPDSFQGVNFDHLWIGKEELATWWRALTPLLDGASPSEPVALPAAVVDRWVRFHLIDNVRGQEGPFAPEDVERAEIISRIVAVEGDRVTVALSGRSRAETDGTWKLGENNWKRFPSDPRGLEAWLAGRATFDRSTGKCTSFLVVAIGESWGLGKLNGRRGRPPGERTALAWRFTWIDPAAPERVPPAFVDLYAVPWIDPAP